MQRPPLLALISLLLCLYTSNLAWAQKELEAGTKALIELVDAKRGELARQKASISRLKEEPSLTSAQVRWLVEIEDALVEADSSYRRAKASVIVADENVGHRDAEMRRSAFRESLKSFDAATTRHDKATRDLETLTKRIELQSKKGDSTS